MKWDEVLRQCFEAGRVLYTQHARREMRNEAFGEVQERDVFEAACACELLEEYPEDAPYASALVMGLTSSDRPLHLVCAYVPQDDLVIVITIYHPDPARWVNNRMRR